MINRSFDWPIFCRRCGREADTRYLCARCDIREIVRGAEIREDLAIAYSIARVHGVSERDVDWMVLASETRTPGRMH